MVFEYFLAEYFLKTPYFGNKPQRGGGRRRGRIIALQVTVLTNHFTVLTNHFFTIFLTHRAWWYLTLVRSSDPLPMWPPQLLIIYWTILTFDITCLTVVCYKPFLTVAWIWKEQVFVYRKWFVTKKGFCNKPLNFGEESLAKQLFFWKLDPSFSKNLFFKALADFIKHLDERPKKESKKPLVFKKKVSLRNRKFCPK